MKSPIQLFTFALSALLLVVMTACGSGNSTSNSSAGTATPAASTAASAAPSAAPTGPKTIKHGLGTTEVKTTPKRIIVLEWTYAEDLIAVGVQPVGVADIKGYKANVNVSTPLADTVVDVGTRQEPNLETITGLKPDLIITAAFRSQKNYDALSKIAPTIAFNPYPAENEGDQYTEMETTFKTIADLVGKKAEADNVLADLQQTYKAAADKLKAANKAGAEFALTQAYTNQNAAALRLFADNSMVVKILEKIGLKNSFKSSKFENYGFSLGSVELLTPIQNTNLIYIVQDNDNVFEKQLKDNAVWKGLTFVKENRTFKLPQNTWTFGGPLSAKVFVDQATTALLTTK
ncbi:ABC transporter substrate-binding protein [Paenibacillus whitsoniae]|uniref:ABC transporter substrate-binding protein n=1 Tax=Paenibacillus whitsoniae TaxID=2496558 RepID=UPI001F49765B|nr:iron-siderophore ABC transporter substrate-binding protein [Paenibacillus whitsoniae]